MRLAGHVTRMGRREFRIGFWWESQKDGDHYNELQVVRG
jgi:hypothetical protein